MLTTSMPKVQRTTIHSQTTQNSKLSIPTTDTTFSKLHNTPVIIIVPSGIIANNNSIRRMIVTLIELVVVVFCLFVGFLWGFFGFVWSTIQQKHVHRELWVLTT